MFHISYRKRRDKFDTDSPTAVVLPDEATHAELEERLQTLLEWQKIRDSNQSIQAGPPYRLPRI
jgi:hypothetical protein